MWDARINYESRGNAVVQKFCLQGINENSPADKLNSWTRFVNKILTPNGWDNASLHTPLYTVQIPDSQVCRVLFGIVFTVLAWNTYFSLLKALFFLPDFKFIQSIWVK